MASSRARRRSPTVLTTTIHAQKRNDHPAVVWWHAIPAARQPPGARCSDGGGQAREEYSRGGTLSQGDLRDRHFTRSRYAPVRVSTRMRSPTDTNKGTCTDTPASSRAVFDPPETVSPRTPGAAATPSSSTAVARAMAPARPSYTPTDP